MIRDSSSASELTPRDRAWQTLADELAPAKSLARIDAATARVISNVSIIGTILMGLGLLTAGYSGTSRSIQFAASLVVAVAVLAITSALLAQVLTIRKGINPNNLEEVKEWYIVQFKRRAYAARTSTLLLILAVAISGVTGILGVLDRERSGSTLAVTQTLTTSEAHPASAGSSLIVDVTFRRLDPSETAVLTVKATDLQNTRLLAQAVFCCELRRYRNKARNSQSNNVARASRYSCHCCSRTMQGVTRPRQPDSPHGYMRGIARM